MATYYDVLVTNMGEAYAEIELSLKKSEYYLLKKVADKLNASREAYAPTLSVVNLNIERELKKVKDAKEITKELVASLTTHEAIEAAKARKAEDRELVEKYIAGQSDDAPNAMALAFKKAIAEKKA